MDLHRCVICLQTSLPLVICNTNTHGTCRNMICYDCYDECSHVNLLNSHKLIQLYKESKDYIYSLICSNKCLLNRIIYINRFGELYMTCESYGHLTIEKQEYILTKIHKRFKKCAFTVLVDVILKDLANIVADYVYKN